MAEFGTVGRSSIDSLLNWSSPPPQDGPSEVQVGTAPPGSVDGGTTVLVSGDTNGGSSPMSPQSGETPGDPGSLVEAGSPDTQATQAGTVDDQAIPPDQAGPAVDQIPPDQAGPADGQGDPTVIQSDQLSYGPETVDDVVDGEPGSVDPQAAEGDPAWEPSDADESADPDGTDTSDDATEDPNAPQDQDDTGNQDDTNDQNGTDTGDQSDTGDQGDTSDPQTDPGTADGQEDPSGSQGQDPADSQTDPGGQTDPSVPDGQDGTTVPETPSTDPSAGGGGTEDPGSGTPETPTTETPTPETPSTDLPTAETPTAETPAADTPSAETPTADMPSAGTPSAETPSSTGGGGGDDQGKGKGGDQTGSTDTTGLTKDSKLAGGGVGGGWRKAHPEVMEKLGKKIGPTEDGKGDTPGDHMGTAESTARNIDIGFPGFGLVGSMTFGSAYSSARSSAADYLKSAKNQLGVWDAQLREGASVVREANDKSTAKN